MLRLIVVPALNRRRKAITGDRALLVPLQSAGEVRRLHGWLDFVLTPWRESGMSPVAEPSALLQSALPIRTELAELAVVSPNARSDAHGVWMNLRLTMRDQRGELQYANEAETLVMPAKYCSDARLGDYFEAWRQVVAEHLAQPHDHMVLPFAFFFPPEDHPLAEPVEGVPALAAAIRQRREAEAEQ